MKKFNLIKKINFEHMLIFNYSFLTLIAFLASKNIIALICYLPSMVLILYSFKTAIKGIANDSTLKVLDELGDILFKNREPDKTVAIEHKKYIKKRAGKYLS